MHEYNGFDRKDLLVQLENIKLVLEVNSELLENDRDLSETISHLLGLLPSRLDELQKGEGMDKIQYNTSLDQANKILVEIKPLVERMLDQDNTPHINSAESDGFSK